MVNVDRGGIMNETINQLNKWTLEKSPRPEFSWSVSRHKTFNSCLKQYYLNYYATYYGRNSGIPEVAELNKMKATESFELSLGTLVHETIAQVLEGVVLEKQNNMEEILQHGIRKLDRLSKESTNVGLGFASEPQQQEYFKKGYEIFVNLRKSETFKWLLSLERQNLLEIDPPFRFFRFEGYKVFAIPDVLVKEEEKYTVVDWKTGKVPSMKDQASVYKLLVHTAYEAPEKNIRVIAEGLREETTVVAKPMSCEDTGKFILGSIKEMEDTLTDGRADYNDFPMTDNLYKCDWCSFKPFCDRMRNGE
jgi:hypothetical protein